MYESKIDHLGKNGSSTCSTIENGPAERQDAKRPMATICGHDGQRLAKPAQSATGQGERQDCPTANVERVCSSRGSHIELQEKPCPKERLVPVGNATTERGLSLHPQKQTELVKTKKPTGQVNIDNVLRLLAHQRYYCALSGRKLTPQTAALDHIVPIRFDGEHVIENTQVLHKDVNRAKGSLTSREFIQLCQEVVLWPKLSTSKKESK